MKVTAVSLLAFAGSLASVGAVVPLSSVSRKTSAPSNIVPGEYIVELDAVKSLAGKRAFASPHESLYSTLRKRDIPFDVKQEFDADGIFTGASMKLTSDGDVASIANLPEVKAIRPIVRIPAPKRIGTHVVSGAKDPLVPTDTQSTHVMTGVDKLHAQGITGKGIKIGIIDSGVDYKHPSLGGGFGSQFKVARGYDFVGDAYTGSNEPQPDEDPMDNCNGHGTHVAGIIGAIPGNAFNISGVSYDAQLAAYRIFGCESSTTDEVIIEAMLRGVKDGNDILTLSLGGVEGWTTASAAVVASRIAKSGIVVTIAAGNDGEHGSWYAASPSTGLDVISVGSVDNTVIPIQNATVQGVQHDPIPYLQALPFKVTTPLEVYATSTDTSVADDACSPLPDSTPDLSNKLIVVRRGTCAFTEKLDNIAAKGGRVFFIYNNGGSFSPIGVGNYTAALISEADGAFLVSQFAAGADITVSFPQEGASYGYPDAHGGLMSDFSTYGPSYDMAFKPAVSAPGGNILSTYPRALGAWAVESGTSMATPFTAGAAALLLQAKGGNKKSTALGMRDLLQTTAKAVPSSIEDDKLLQTVSQQGAGLISVSDALAYTTIVSPGQFTLNDTAHFRNTQTFTILNTGKQSVTYKLEHVAAGTALTVDEKKLYTALGPVPLTSNTASVKLSQTSVTLAPGKSAKVTATFTPPKGDDPARLPVFSGFIRVQGARETLHVTYLGVAAALKDKAVLDTSDVYFGEKLPLLVDTEGNPQGNASAYTLNGTDAPAVIYRLAFGTPLLRFDLIAKDANVQTALDKRAAFSWWWGAKPDASTFAAVKIVGTLAEYDYNPRNTPDAQTPEENGYSVFSLEPTFADGKPIKDGDYRILVRALRVTGDWKKEKDYEVWTSPAFTIKRS